MNLGAFLLVFCSVVLSSSAQLLLKAGMTSPAVQRAMAAAEPGRIIAAIATTWMIYAGLFFFAASVMLWLFALARLPLSVAYPFASMGFVITAVGSAFLLGENISPVQIIGTVLIVLGCLLVARVL